MGAENYVHRLLGTMIGLCGDELLWKVHKISQKIDANVVWYQSGRVLRVEKQN